MKVGLKLGGERGDAVEGTLDSALGDTVCPLPAAAGVDVGALVTSLFVGLLVSGFGLEVGEAIGEAAPNIGLLMGRVLGAALGGTICTLVTAFAGIPEESPLVGLVAWGAMLRLGAARGEAVSWVGLPVGGTLSAAFNGTAFVGAGTAVGFLEFSPLVGLGLKLELGGARGDVVSLVGFSMEDALGEAFDGAVCSLLREVGTVDADSPVGPVVVGALVDGLAVVGVVDGFPREVVELEVVGLPVVGYNVGLLTSAVGAAVSLGFVKASSNVGNCAACGLTAGLEPVEGSKTVGDRTGDGETGLLETECGGTKLLGPAGFASVMMGVSSSEAEGDALVLSSATLSSTRT